MISAPYVRRRRTLLWSTFASAAFHFIFLTLIFYAVAHVFVPRGQKEVVSQTTLVTIQKKVRPKPAPLRRVRRQRTQETVPAKVPLRELARDITRPAPREPQHRPAAPSKVQRDEAGFAREVAQLNAQNDPRAIPTIDPSARRSTTKSYQFALPSSSRGEEQGNGIITPVRAWRDSGQDCYYGHYQFTYPDGATEEGNIVWPFCFDPTSDPFKEPPHPIPFPLPLPGFRLPADAQLPPIEKAVYRQWASENGIVPSN